MEVYEESKEAIDEQLDKVLIGIEQMKMTISRQRKVIETLEKDLEGTNVLLDMADSKIDELNQELGH